MNKYKVVHKGRAYKVTAKDSASAVLKVMRLKDDRLSPMTYAKLKELGYSSEDWKKWNQEQANQIVAKGKKTEQHSSQKKGEEKSSKTPSSASSESKSSIAPKISSKEEGKKSESSDIKKQQKIVSDLVYDDNVDVKSEDDYKTKVKNIATAIKEVNDRDTLIDIAGYVSGDYSPSQYKLVRFHNYDQDDADRLMNSIFDKYYAGTDFDVNYKNDEMGDRGGFDFWATRAHQEASGARIADVLLSVQDHLEHYEEMGRLEKKDTWKNYKNQLYKSAKLYFKNQDYVDAVINYLEHKQGNPWSDKYNPD